MSEGNGKAKKTSKPEVRDPKTGRYQKGNKTGGRKHGSKDGIKEFRRLLSKHAAEMSEEGMDIDTLITNMRKKGDDGVWWIVKNLILPVMKDEKEARQADRAPVIIQMVAETPPPKFVEARQPRQIEAKENQDDGTEQSE